VIVAIFISLICHIFCFSSVEFIFTNGSAGKGVDLARIFFLGPILQEGDYYSQPTAGLDSRIGRLNSRIFADMLNAEASPRHEIAPDYGKHSSVNLIDNKIVYFNDSPAPKTDRQESSIMFYPPIPYHFLLYFRDRQTAHMEVAFYISPEGKILGLKRKISSGNPEVDLLIMRNLTHFLSLSKSNFALGSWQTVKIDLSP